MATDVHERIASGIVTTIQGLNLLQFDGVTPMSVYKQTITDARSINFPCTIVHFEDAQEEEDYTFEMEMPMYPLTVLLVDRQDGADESWRPKILGWRKQILDVLRPLTSLPGVPEVWNVTVKPMRAIPSDLFRGQDYQHVLSGLQVQAFTAEQWQHS